MQQDSCNTFIFATFCPECWTILAFGVAKMPKLSKLLPGPEWSWSCYTSEAISISITFSLDRSLCEKVSGSLIIYYIIGNLLFQCCVATFLGQKYFQEKHTLKTANCMRTMCVQNVYRHICYSHACGKIPAEFWTGTLPAWIIYLPSQTWCKQDPQLANKASWKPASP